MSIKVYLLAQWPMIDCECEQEYNWRVESIFLLRMFLPIIMGIYLQHKTQVDQFIKQENEKKQQVQIERIFHE